MSAHTDHTFFFLHSITGHQNQGLKTDIKSVHFRHVTFSHFHAHCTYIKGINDISGDITRRIAALRSTLSKTPHASPLRLVRHLEALVWKILSIQCLSPRTLDSWHANFFSAAGKYSTTSFQIQQVAAKRYWTQTLNPLWGWDHTSSADPPLACLLLLWWLLRCYVSICVVFLHSTLQRPLDNLTVTTIVSDGPFYICSAVVASSAHAYCAVLFFF